MILKKQILFTKTILFYPLILFLLSQIVCTIYSIDPYTSFWGYYSRFNGGLASTISYILLYFAFSSNLKKKETLLSIKLALFSSFLVGLYGIFQHFGIDKEFWVQDVQRRVFSTLGQPNWLAAYIAAFIPLSFWLVLENSSRKGFKKYTGLFLSTSLYLCLLFTKSRSGFLAFSISFPLFWGGFFFLKEKSFISFKKPFLFICFLFLIFGLLIGTPYSPNIKSFFSQSPVNQLPQIESQEDSTDTPLLISESSDIRKIVWRGAFNIFKANPIFGTGVETFAYSYYQYRPKEHNDLSEWDFLYNKAHNEYLNFAANSGLLGLITYIAFIGSVVFSLKSLILKKDIDFQDKIIILGLLAGFSTLLITNFFGFSVVCTNLFLFLFPALGLALVKKEPEEKNSISQETSGKMWLGIILVIVLGLSSISYFIKFLKADINFARASGLNKADYYEEAYNNLVGAISFRKNEPIYHNELAYSSAGIAYLLGKAQDSSNSAEFARLAILESDKALSINSYHINFWKKRARVFFILAKIDSSYLNDSLEALLTAAKLAPTDAKIQYNIGLLENNLDKRPEAIKALEEAIRLKPNYIDSYYTLGLIYEEMGEKQKAKETFEKILEIDPNHSQAKEKLEKY